MDRCSNRSIILTLCPMRVRGWTRRGGGGGGAAWLAASRPALLSCRGFSLAVKLRTVSSRIVVLFQRSSPSRPGPAPARYHLLISAAPSWRDAIADSTLVELCPLEISIPAACGGAGPGRCGATLGVAAPRARTYNNPPHHRSCPSPASPGHLQDI